MEDRKKVATRVLQIIKEGLGEDLDLRTQNSIHDQICYNIEQTEKRCKDFFQGQLDDGKTFSQIDDNNSHMEDYLYQCFRQRNIDLNSVYESDKKNHPEPHLIAIRRNSSILKEHLQLEGTMLLDQLIERDVLSDAGRQSILSRKTSVARNTAFLDNVANRFNEHSFRTVFLPELEKEHAVLAAQLLKDLDSPNNAFPSVRLCQSCVAKSKINIRKFANHLHQSGLITECLCTELVSHDMSESLKWDVMHNKLKKNAKGVMAALCTFSEPIFQTLQQTNCTLLVCTCDELSTVVQMSDVTDTGEDKDGEADVARMSDFSSEVGSVTSQSTGTDRDRHMDCKSMKAPLPPTSRDRLFSSPKPLVENIDVSDHDNKENRLLRGHAKFHCTCTREVLDMETMLTRKSKEMQILSFKLKKLKRRSLRNALIKLRGGYKYRVYANRNQAS